MNHLKHSGLGILSLLLTPSLLIADVMLEQSVRIEARGLISVFDSLGTRVIEISGNSARIERFDGDAYGPAEDSAIISLDRDTAWILDPMQATYEVFDLQQLRSEEERDIELIQEMPQSGPDALPVTEQACQWTRPLINLDRTGEKTRIAGLRAEQYLVTMASSCRVPESSQVCDVTWVLDYWNARRMPGDREVLDFRRALADRFRMPELLALSGLVPRGLLALFEDGWDEVFYEADGLKGFPVKTIMSLHIGGEDCRTRSNDEITRDTVWSKVREDSIQATKNEAARTAGNVVAGEVFRRVGGNIGGMIASGAAGVLTRDAAAKAMEKDEQSKAVQVGDESLADRVPGQVQVFRITTELNRVNDNRLPAGRLEVPGDWKSTGPE